MSAQIDDRRMQALLRAYRALVRDGIGVEDATREIFEIAGSEVVARRVAELFQDYASREEFLGDPKPLSRDRERWYQGPRSDGYWAAVTDLLRRGGWSEPEIQGLDAASSNIVAQLAHPATRAFRVYGLVLGHVQAGKTT